MNFGDLNNENNINNNSAPEAPNNRNKKLIWAGVILVALILAVIGWQYWQYIHSSYYQQMKAVKMIEAKQKESDKWGGKTPEETVALFRDAIKKGDFDLASKYGYPELTDPLVKNPKTIKTTLEKIKADGQIDQLVKWLTTGELQEISGFGGSDFNLIVKENNQKIWILSIHKSDGGTWKIDEF